MLDRATLKEWSEKEQETVKHISRDLSRGEEFDFRDLYPEFKSLEGKSLYSHAHREFKVKELLIFNNVVILNIHPTYDEKIFHERYGITVEEALELLENGMIELRLAGRPELYENCPLGDLLYKASEKYGNHIPYAGRHFEVAKVGVAEAGKESFLHKAYNESYFNNKEIKGRLEGEYRNAVQAILGDEHEVERYVAFARDLYVFTHGKKGPRKIVDDLVQGVIGASNPKEKRQALEKIRAMAHVYIWPLTCSLGGKHTFPSKYFRKVLELAHRENLPSLIKELSPPYEFFVRLSHGVFNVNPENLSIDTLKNLSIDSAKSALERIVTKVNEDINERVYKPLYNELSAGKSMQKAIRDVADTVNDAINNLKEEYENHMNKVLNDYKAAVESYMRWEQRGVPLVYNIGGALLIEGILRQALTTTALSALLIFIAAYERVPVWLFGRLKRCPVLSDILEVRRHLQ